MADLPQIPQNLDPQVRNLLTRLVEEVRVLRGYTGNRFDMAVTWENLRTAGAVDVPDGYRVRPGYGPGNLNFGRVVGTNAGTGTGAVDPGDLTPPPTPTGLVATSSPTQVLVEWNVAPIANCQGTRVYAVKSTVGAPLPVFSDAELHFEATHPLTMALLPSDTSVRWHFWLKYVTLAGVESPDPAGGINGVQATTGLIDNARIGSLSANKITAGTLAAGTEIRSTNYAAGSAGFMLRATDGYFEASNGVFRGTLSVRSATSGARLEILSDRILVYDSSGILRARFGNLA